MNERKTEGREIIIGEVRDSESYLHEGGNCRYSWFEKWSSLGCFFEVEEIMVREFGSAVCYADGLQNSFAWELSPWGLMQCPWAVFLKLASLKLYELKFPRIKMSATQ